MFFVFGVRSLSPLMSFTLSTFVLTTIVVEFYRGALARAHIANQNFLRALWNLTMRNKRRYGGYIVHLGVIMIFAGITGSSAFQKEKMANLAPDESMQIAEYTLHYQGLVDQSTEHAQVVAAKMQVERAGQTIATLFPAKQKHQNHDPVSEVAIRQTPKEDLYLILTGWDEQERASLKVLVIPLVAWIWIGGIVMIIGTLIALGPDRIERRSKIVHAKTVARSQLEAEYEY
jgi:cytochrome c-type biogenesis protein CcmF